MNVLFVSWLETPADVIKAPVHMQPQIYARLSTQLHGMVLLTITPAASTAIERYSELVSRDDASTQLPDEPSLVDAAVGDAISHAQLIEIARYLKEHHERISNQSSEAHADLPESPFRLDTLLKGAKFYVPPPKPKPETVRISSLAITRTNTNVCNARPQDTKPSWPASEKKKSNEPTTA